MTVFIYTGPADSRIHLLLTHGASEAVDRPFLTAFAESLSGRGVRVARFEFEYLAQRRHGGSKRPPPRTPVLEEELRQILSGYAHSGPVFIGGKSMGGRIASMVAEEQFLAGRVAGAVCLGYPFHPPGKPENLRTAHLEEITAPVLICQGTRDPFGTREDVAGYKLSKAIELQWLEDGEHSFKARKASGFTQEQHIEASAEIAHAFMQKRLNA